MHKQGRPANMQLDPRYEDVVDEVYRYLAKKAVTCRNAGIHDLIVDPGFGFGKNLEHNYTLLKHLPQLGILECPILIGVSRKAMIKKVVAREADQCLNGTTVVNTIALMKGASILRVHDPREAMECISITSKLNEME
jgi:dihydropteroate synthase